MVTTRIIFLSLKFFISTNWGETLRPLSKIAAGGEISRIMLAIKMALQSVDLVSTLIFDEIDAGISGSVAEEVGNTIEGLSQTHQILCITHLFHKYITIISQSVHTYFTGIARLFHIYFTFISQLFHNINLLT